MLSLDVHDAQYWRPVVADPAAHQSLMDWCIEHGVIPGWTFRLEIEIVDCGILRAFGWARDENGKYILVDGPDGQEMKESVREVVLQSDPPVTFREE